MSEPVLTIVCAPHQKAMVRAEMDRHGLTGLVELRVAPSPVPAGTERAAVWMQALGNSAPDVWAALTPRQRGAVAEALMPVADAEVAAAVVSSSPATPAGGCDEPGHLPIQWYRDRIVEAQGLLVQESLDHAWDAAAPSPATPEGERET